MNLMNLLSRGSLACGVVSVALALITTGRVAAAEPQKAANESKPTAKTDDNGGEWKPLFDGKTLKGWKITDFAGHGEVAVDPQFRGDPKLPAAPAIVAEMGAILTGVTLTNPAPEGEYEVTLEAMKVEGSDFFSALTFPAAGGHCSLIVGGWGGGVVGISSVDSMDASENETTKFLSFQTKRWYPIRVRVTKEKIEAWIDQEKVVDLETADRRISVRAGEIELAKPFGLSAYQTRAAWRNIKVREL
ncbi:MAG: family 16 glycoside hydrolase [Verrucomicrobiia bacterium]